MPKILAQAGTSLADVYDVEGSIAGVEVLLSEDVNLVHEMGKTIFAERFTGSIVSTLSGSVAQNLTVTAQGPELPQNSRLLGLTVFTTEIITRLDDCCILLASEGTELPIWVWEQADGEVNALFTIATTLGDNIVLLPNPAYPPMLPNLICGTDQPSGGTGPTRLLLRGNTSGFGAGTTKAGFIAYFGFARSEGLSSRGLPLPGW